MTPLEVEILLHYRCSGRDYREGDFEAPAVREAIDYFRNRTGMLETECNGLGRNYQLTEKGRFYVDAICSIPLPEAQWIIPNESET